MSAAIAVGEVERQAVDELGLPRMDTSELNRANFCPASNSREMEDVLSGDAMLSALPSLRW